MNNNTPIPVYMYHSVGIPNQKWQWNHLTCPYTIFEKQMKWISKFGYKTITLSELYDYIFNNKKIDKKSIILTFDDGYLDNWIFAFSILKKYGLKGTIFVNPDFVDKRNIIRKQYKTDKNPKNINKRKVLGFMSWRELKISEQESIFDIQSHALTHTWYPISNKIIDFRRPKDNYIWMTWNSHKELKPYLQIDDPNYINYGKPVYRFGKSLNNKRYFPDPRISELLISHVKKNGNINYFRAPDWKEKLFRKVEDFKAKHSICDAYEKDMEYQKRIKYELMESKNIIEKKLNKKVEFLCWPGGSGSDIGVRIAKKVGYKMSTTARDLSLQYRKKLKNTPDQQSDRIARVSPILYWNGKENEQSKIIYYNPLDFILSILIYKNTYLAAIWGKIYRKLKKIIMSKLHQVSL